MTKNVELIYSLIQKDLKAQGWDDSAIAEAIAESQRERRATGTDDNTICVKEISYLTQKSLLEVTKKMNRKNIAEQIKTTESKIRAGVKVIMPYMSLIAVVLCLINLIYLAKIQSDIKAAEENIINFVELAEINIIDSVKDVESNVSDDLFFWGN